MKEIDLEGVREEIETFMFAGHDTTTSTISFALNFISENEIILKKCKNELSDIFEDSARLANFDDLKKMKFLEACIKETMRMRAPVPRFSRRMPTGGQLLVKDKLYKFIPQVKDTQI